MKAEDPLTETTVYRAVAPLPARAGVAAPLPDLPGAPSAAPGAARIAAPEVAAPAAPARPGLRQSVSALHHRNFRLFWTGQLISLIGTWMQMIARAWLVYQLAAGTGREGFWLGMVGVASSVPVLCFSLYAGVVVDRVAKQRLIIITQIASMILAFVLAALTATGLVQIWHVLAISVLLGLVNAFDAPARQAFVFEMVGKEDLMNAIALNSTIFNAARVLGPAIAGALLGLLGPALCFFLNGASYIAVIAGLLMMRLPPHRVVAQAESAWTKLREGLTFIRGDQTVLPLLLLVGVNSFFGMNYSTLAPIFADSVLKVGQSGYGLLMAAAGVGALIGAVNLAVQSSQTGLRRGRLILIGSALFGVALSAFALSKVFPLSLLLLVGVGWSLISQNATTNTVIQTTTPDHLRGRVMSVYALLLLGLAPLGSLLAGTMTDLWSAPTALFISGVICVLSAVVVWRWRPQLAQVR